MNDKAEIREILETPSDIAILTHRNPDGDALGSSLALKAFLEKKGSMVKIILPSEYPSTFHYLDDVDQCIIYDLEQDKAIDWIKNANVIFCLDFNGLDRIDKIGNYVLESRATKFLIDHHLDPEPFSDYMFSDTAASSTCELVYKFLFDLDYGIDIDVKIGTALFTGLITDTGSFKYATRDYTYHVASKLKQIGVDDYTLNDLIFNTYSEKQLNLLGHCLVNRMDIMPEYSAGMIALTKDDFAKFKISRGDTEGIVNYILMLKGIKVAAFIREQPQVVKISLRSKGDISVQEIARNHFNGGGHKNAAGGHAYAKLEDIKDRFRKVLPYYINKKQ